MIGAKCSKGVSDQEADEGNRDEGDSGQADPGQTAPVGAGCGDIGDMPQRADGQNPCPQPKARAQQGQREGQDDAEPGPNAASSFAPGEGDDVAPIDVFTQRQ